jgi:formylglycine-generating enzyme required for sulfatase activity
MAVTLPEARCFAHYLGGEVPTQAQWLKAAGEKDGADGPWERGKAPKKFVITQNQKRPGPPQPWRVGDPDGDKTVFGCFDMADNGREWTASAAGGRDLINQTDGVERKDGFYLRGNSFIGDEVWTFKYAVEHRQLSYLREEPPDDVGFRVVIEPPRK